MPYRKQPEKRTQKKEGTTSARGYGWAWQKLRLLILQRDPLCKLCPIYRPGFAPKAASQVDHIVPKAQGGTDEVGNLQGACDYCNAAKGGRE
jgi:5-methylcytosine-specific restriction protein A